MICIRDVTDAGDICQLLFKFDPVMPHLKEKVSDYRTFSEKLSRFARVLVIEKEETMGIVVFYANDMTSKTAYVSLLACLPEYQGMGLGKKLMDHAFAEAKMAGMTAMRLEVDLDNASAIAFYQKIGFSPTGETLPGSMYMEKKLRLE